jgi:hypothetical protein
MCATPTHSAYTKKHTLTAANIVEIQERAKIMREHAALDAFAQILRSLDALVVVEFVESMRFLTTAEQWDYRDACVKEMVLSQTAAISDLCKTYLKNR